MNNPEAWRRMPAVSLIDSYSLRDRTVEEIKRFPDYFWTAPATSSDRYHNRFARGERGLWIHVLMAATAIERVLDSHVEQGNLTDMEADYARSAILLHDGRKYGNHYQKGSKADKDHDVQMAKVLRERGFPEDVYKAVASHMGPWYDGPEPTTTLQQVVHQADMIASARHVTPAVYDAPNELLERWPNLPRCSPDDNQPVRETSLSQFDGGDSE